jgi:hypothetical protein
MIIGIVHTNSRRKVEKVSYDVGMEGFLGLHSNWDQKFRFLRTLHSVQNRICSSLANVQNCITLKPFIISGHVNNGQKEEREKSIL